MEYASRICKTQGGVIKGGKDFVSLGLVRAAIAFSEERELVSSEQGV